MEYKVEVKLPKKVKVVRVRALSVRAARLHAREQHPNAISVRVVKCRLLRVRRGEGKIMARQSLIQKALGLSKKINEPIKAPTGEEIDLALAFLREQITAAAVGKVLNLDLPDNATTEPVKRWVFYTLRRGLAFDCVRITKTKTIKQSGTTTINHRSPHSWRGK